MKNLYIILVCLLMNSYVFSQQYITWNATNNANQLTGTFGGTNTVTVTQIGGGNPILITSPATGNSGNNLFVNGANTFRTTGPSNQPPSPNLVFTFSTPVIITQYNMSEIDRGGNWDDSFNFNNITFTNTLAPTNVVTTVNGANVANSGNNANGFASWLCSNPVNNFSLNYVGNGGTLTHAVLGYSIEVLVPPSLPTICFGDTVAFPIVGNNIAGTWNPAVINTNAIGTNNYTFTPNAGQPIQCPINMPVTVIDCCTPTLTTNNNVTTQLQRERSNWIMSTDNISFSDGIQGNGVVYHAGNFVELNPGFEAIFDSQFSAYIEGCSGNYVYREFNTEIESKEESINVNSDFKIISEHKYFDIIVNSLGTLIEIPLTDFELKNIEIYSIQGELLYSGSINIENNTIINIAHFSTGVYLVKTISAYGNMYTNKFIKK